MKTIGTEKDPVMAKSLDSLLDSYAGKLRGSLTELEYYFYKVIEARPDHLTEEQRVEARKKYILVIEAVTERIKQSETVSNSEN